MIEERIKKARKITGLSQRKFAEKLGIAYRSLQTYEKNATSLTIAMAEKIASLCGISPSWLLTGEGDMAAKEKQTWNVNDVTPAYTTAETVNFTDLTHAELVKEFKQKELAKEINRLIVEIEKVDPEELTELKEYLEFKLMKRTESKPDWNGSDRRKKG